MSQGSGRVVSRTGLRQHLANEDGISLVEVMVAVMVIAVSLTAFASTAIQSLSSITNDEQMVRATQLAAEQLEALRAIDWDAAGFYANDPGYGATAGDGAPMVTLGPTRPAGSTGILPTQVVVRDGISYTADVEIVWRDDPNSPPPPASDPDPNDYKEFRTTLSWTVRDKSRVLEQTAVRQPTLNEVGRETEAPCVAGSVVSFDVTPAQVRLDASGRTMDAISVIAETCSTSSSVNLSPSPAAARALTADPSSSGKIWRTSSFPVGTSGFSAGSYTWQINTFGADGNATETTEIAFVEAGTGLLAVDNLSITPGLCVATNGTPHRTHQLTATISGAAASDAVTMSWTGRADSAAAGTGVGAGPRTFTATMPTSAKLNHSTTTVSVSVTRASDGINVTESFVVNITRTNAPGSCP